MNKEKIIKLGEMTRQLEKYKKSKDSRFAEALQKAVEFYQSEIEPELEIKRKLRIEQKVKREIEREARKEREAKAKPFEFTNWLED